MKHQSNPGVYARHAAEWPSGRQPRGSGIVWAKELRGKRRVTAPTRASRGESPTVGNPGLSRRAREPRPQAGARHHHHPARAGPARVPLSRFRPRGLRGPDPPAGPGRSPLPRRAAAAPRHRAPGARLSNFVPSRTKVTPREVKRPVAKTEGTHAVLVPTCHLAIAVQPQPSGRFILFGEACQKGGHFRSLAVPGFVWLRGRKCTYAKRHFC